MRLPEETNRWKRDGRTINLDLTHRWRKNDKPGDKPSSLRFAEWHRSDGWSESTQYSGLMRNRGQTTGQATWASGSDVRRQIQFINKLFGVAA